MEELISIFDEVNDDGGGSEEGCGKRLMRRLKLKSTTSKLGRAATSRLPPPQIHDWHHRNCFKLGLRRKHQDLQQKPRS
ncbi:hypothetical protein COP2_025242 [Malus domestica]